MLENYQDRILHFLNEMIGPVDVEKIRKNCKIANWNTALKHCLELMVKGKIKGEQTSKGWVFWIHQPIDLQPWQEAIGKFYRLTMNGDNAIITLTIQKTIHITLPTNTPEAQATLQTLKNIPIGTEIALLKTNKTIIIRTLNEPPESFKFFCASLVVRSRLFWIASKMIAFNITLWYLGLR